MVEPEERLGLGAFSEQWEEVAHHRPFKLVVQEVL
jgi:hypothetical protein